MPTVKVLKTQEVDVDITLTPEQEKEFIPQIAYRINTTSFDSLAELLTLLYSTRPDYKDADSAATSVCVINTILNADGTGLTDEQKEAIYQFSNAPDTQSDTYKYLKALFLRGLAIALRDLASDQDTKANILLSDLPKENMPSPVSRMW